MTMLGISLRDPVRTLMGAVVATIEPTATLREAAHALAADAVGLLVVVDPRGVQGVLSERDIVSAVTDELDLDEARVRDHSSLDIVEIDEETSVLEAAEVMSSAEVRHLAVTRGGVVIGVISMRDIVNVLAEQAEDLSAS